MDPVELEHRITKLEVAVEVLPDMQATLNAINTKFAKYEGRWGLITMLAAGLWAILVAFKDNILHLFNR